MKVEFVTKLVVSSMVFGLLAFPKIGQSFVAGAGVPAPCVFNVEAISLCSGAGTGTPCTTGRYKCKSVANGGAYSLCENDAYTITCNETPGCIGDVKKTTAETNATGCTP